MALGLSLGLRITADGIETREQLAVLRRLGCPAGQGYLFSRPLSAEALSRLAGEGRASAGFDRV
jgi:EAL domain-containing protein (putative c-di-GMP-specific phosphodiesterase class I)